MIVSELISPDSIVVVGASHDTSKPGGKVLKNILEHNYVGRLYAVNPKPFVMKGVVCYDSCEVLPAVDMAIIAIAAPMVEECIRILTIKKNVKHLLFFQQDLGKLEK